MRPFTREGRGLRHATKGSGRWPIVFGNRGGRANGSYVGAAFASNPAADRIDDDEIRSSVEYEAR